MWRTRFRALYGIQRLIPAPELAITIISISSGRNFLLISLMRGSCLPRHGCVLRAAAFGRRVKGGMDSGHGQWGLASDHIPPSPSQREAGVLEEVGELAGRVPYLYLLQRLEAQAAPWGSPRLSSFSPAWAACLLGTVGYSPRLLGPAWLGELCKEGTLCQRVTGQLPCGHHLGCTEPGSQGRPMASSPALWAPRP